MDEKNNHNIEILKEIHKTAAMGVDSLNFLKPGIEQQNTKQNIKEQINTLTQIEKRARQELEAKGEVPQQIETKIGLWMSTSPYTNENKTPSNTARMLIEGNATGIMDLTRTLNSNPLADTHLKETAKKLLDAGQQSIKTIEKYL